MENHHFQWVNPLFLWPFWIYSYVKLPEGTIWLFIGGYTTQYIGDYNNPRTGNPYKTNLIVMGIVMGIPIVMGIVMDGIVTWYFLTTKLMINPLKSTINGHFSRLFFLLRNRGTLRCLHPSLHGLRGQMVRVRGPLFWARLDGRVDGDQNHGLTINTWGFHLILICKKKGPKSENL